jgi:hypothetical protein
MQIILFVQEFESISGRKHLLVRKNTDRSSTDTASGIGEPAAQLRSSPENH